MRSVTSLVAALAVALVPGVAEARTFAVNSTTDAVDSQPGDGTCRTSSRNCTLRAAIQEANASPGPDTVQVRAGTYTLTRNGSGADAGDHDVTSPVTIAGASAATTVLDGGPASGGLDRLIEVHAGAGDVTISNLTIRDGRPGGIQSATAGRLRIESVAITATAGTALASSAGTVEVRRSTFTNSTGEGAHIHAGTARIENSTLSSDGLTAAAAADVELESVTVTGGTISRAPGVGRLVLRNTIAAGGCAGPVGSAGGNVDPGMSCALAAPGDRVNADPRLDPLAANGGTTQSHALRRGSRALDGGLSPCPPTDQRGLSRPQGAGCDAGAYEAAPFPPDGAAPQTSITATPGTLTGAPAATFRFTGTDDVTAPADLAFECRLDGAAEWTACTSPATYAGLAQGPHAFEVRAYDEAGNADPTPARHQWTIDTCAAANVTATANADAWIDESDTGGNKGGDATLKIQSKPGVNWRALIRFALPTLPAGCVVESARLRIYASAGSDGSLLEAHRIAGPWQENGVTWGNQPATTGAPRTAYSGEDYRTWSVAPQVQAMLETGASHGFLIKDADEDSDTGGSSELHSREKGENPPQLVIRFAPPLTGPPPPPAPPVDARVSCGQELTASTRLTNDLTDCGTGDGLVIGNHRIIVDLNGHTIDGVGLGSGIRNDGFSGVVIRNGTVRDWDHGIQLQAESRANLVENLVLADNEVTGAELSMTADSELRGNRLTGNGGGIALLAGTTGTLVTANELSLNSGAQLLVKDSSGNRLEGNAVSGEGGGDIGVGLEDAGGNTVIRNTVTGTSDGGLEITAGAHGNRIEANVLTGTGDAGIHVDASDGNELVGNVVSEMSDSAISLALANDGVIERNVLRANPGAIEVSDSSGNRIEANDASDNDGNAIELGAGSVANHIVRNTVRGNGAIGIHLTEEAAGGQGNLVERNVATANGGDGIVTAKGGHTLTGNVATGNGGWGIQAAGGTFDGGENVATGNGTGQCSGIACNVTLPPPDGTAPQTVLLAAPATSSGQIAFEFDGSDDATADDDLDFECRLNLGDWAPCTSPAAYTALEPGPNTFAVRAVDAAGNADPTPAEHAWTDVRDVTLPETQITSAPADESAPDVSFAFTGSDAEGPVSFECQIGEGGWEPCASPQPYRGLAPGAHSFRVRAIDAGGNADPTPAAHEWTVRAVPVCPADLTATATADAWVDESSPTANKGDDSTLKIQSKAPRDDFRSLIRFALPAGVPADCRIASATLRLYADKGSTGRTLQAIALAAPWTERGVTWANQPATIGPAATTAAGAGYRQWNVTGQVQAMLAPGANHGFLIRDAAEGGSGAEQGYFSREKGEQPPQLVVRFAGAS